jgi:hypothetical protein
MLLFVFVLLSSFAVKPAHPFKSQATMASLLLIPAKKYCSAKSPATPLKICLPTCSLALEIDKEQSPNN